MPARAETTCTVRGCGRPAARENASGLELVVRREQRPKTVEDADALGFEPADLPDARLDAVDRREDV